MPAPSEGKTDSRVRLCYRPPSGGRWQTVGTFATWREALARVDSAGDWRLTAHTPAPATKTRRQTPSLFGEDADQ